MIANAPPAANGNAAWVRIETPLSVQELVEFCRDIERLYRINPYLEFETWRQLAGNRWHTVFRNLSNGQKTDVEIFRQQPLPDAFSARYSQGIKRSTRFEIAAMTSGSVLTITDDYSDVQAQQAQREVDRSLHAWGTALHEYLPRHARWKWCAPWRWYMRHVWTPMKPGARRITYILLLVMIADLVLFALVMAIWWAEQQR